MNDIPIDTDESPAGCDMVGTRAAVALDQTRDAVLSVIPSFSRSSAARSESSPFGQLGPSSVCSFELGGFLLQGRKRRWNSRRNTLSATASPGTSIQ